MKNELKSMYVQIMSFDAIIAITAGILTYGIYPKFFLVAVFGVLVACINFLVNGVITNFALTKQNTIYIMLSFIVRVGAVVGIGLIIYNYYNGNIASITTYILGYSAHFIAILLYGITSKNHQ